jgi:HEXXH motif-containing protein
MGFGFLPDAAQAKAFDRKVRRSLADSLEHIAGQARGQLPFDVASLEPVIARMRGGARYPCATFALYAEAVLAICEHDNELAAQLLERITLERPLTQPWRVLPLDAPQHAPHAERYLRFMGSDPTIDFAMFPAPPAIAAPFTQRLLDARELIGQALPDFAGEFDALVSDVLLVVGDNRAPYQFDGGSSYLMWGGLFLNATSHDTLVGMVEVMAHECGHILLYACAADEALVENEDEEVFASPLRQDPRPMDGIYHATFVSARMHWAMSSLLASALLDEPSRLAAQNARDQDVENFWSGFEIVSRHGRLTATGREVMREAQAWMETAR